MKKIILTLLTLTILTSCGNEPTKNSAEEIQPSNQNASVEKTQDKDSKKIGGEEKGLGKITLATPGGEGSEVTLIVADEALVETIGINYKNIDVDGNEPTYLYIDGQEVEKIQLSKDVETQSGIPLYSDKNQLSPGLHNVEIIQEINGEQTFYRLLTYEVK